VNPEGAGADGVIGVANPEGAGVGGVAGIMSAQETNCCVDICG